MCGNVARLSCARTRVSGGAAWQLGALVQIDLRAAAAPIHVHDHPLAVSSNRCPTLARAFARAQVACGRLSLHGLRAHSPAPWRI